VFIFITVPESVCKPIEQILNMCIGEFDAGIPVDIIQRVDE
jgi:hypothetical protein